MSLNDSFMQEVSDEVRRDRLFGLFRKYAWIGFSLILLLVGGAAFHEWKKNKNKIFAELNGDELRQILNSFSDTNDTESYFLYLDKNLPGKPLAALNPIFLTTGNNIPEKLTHLEGVANNLDLPIALRDLALLYRFHLLQSDFEEKMDTLKILAGPDRPYRLLAIEAKIDLLLSKKSFKEALTEVNLLEKEISSSIEMKNRVQNLKRIILDLSQSD